jgi:hypothetical protein
MSALSGSPQTFDGWPRPRLFKLLGAVIGGEVLGWVVLWILGIVLEVAGLAPLGGAQQWVWLPWHIDGVWAVVGAIGWGYLVCTLVGVLVSDGITRRGYERPAAAWLRISIAISGYGAMAVGRTNGARVALAVLGAAVVIRLVAFNPDGSARAWRWTLTPRQRVLMLLLAALVGLSYTALHPFTANGNGGNYASATIVAHVGHTNEVDIGLNAIHIPAQITAVTLTGSGAAHFRVHSIVLTTNGQPETVIPRRLGNQYGARLYGGYVQHATRFPYRAPTGKGVWITAQVTLTSCAAISVNTLRLRYTMLGISTAESIPLSQPLKLRCAT